MSLSERVNKVKPSPTLAVFAKAAALRQEGKDIISLGVGEPDFDTPEHIKEAAIASLRDGQTKYTPVDGTPELKQAVCDKFKKENRLSYEPSQILISCGAKHSIYNALQALINPGDEVIIPAPYWVSYPDMVLLAEGKPVIVETSPEDKLKLTATALDNALTPKTKMVILNSPSNPTGIAYSAAEWRDIAEILLQYPDVLILTDDMYEHIYWANEPFSNILMNCPDLYERTIVVNGISKAYAMTGWRIGYMAARKDYIAAMKKIQSQSTSCPASTSQAGALAALTGSQACIKDMTTAFHERHDIVVERLNKMNGVSCIPADGTFYCFPNIEQAIAKLPDVNSDVEFAELLLEKVGVALVPGTAFGAPGYFRLSFATDLDVLHDALDRIEKCLP